MTVNPDGSYTQVARTGYFLRIGGSFRGIGAGIAMLAAALALTGAVFLLCGKKAVPAATAAPRPQQTT